MLNIRLQGVKMENSLLMRGIPQRPYQGYGMMLGLETQKLEKKVDGAYTSIRSMRFRIL